MDTVSLDEAKKLLEPYAQTLKEIFINAWQKFGQLSPELNFPLGTRSRACMVNDYVCYEVRHKFDNMPGISIADHPELFILNFNNLLLMRFKLLDEQYRASNIPTLQQKMLNDQTIQLILPSMPRLATRIIAGYQLNRAQTDIKDILITCPQGSDIVWYFSIFGDGPDTLQYTLPIDEPPMNGPRVKAKNLRKKSDV